MNAEATILLVEDNPMDVDLTIRAFSYANSTATIVVARDGEEALGFVPRWAAGEPTPNVILLDLNLPRISGFEVLRLLKSDPVARVIPVVTLSTSRAPQDVRRAYELGANSYVVKAIDFDRFIETARAINGYWTGINQV